MSTRFDINIQLRLSELNPDPNADSGNFCHCNASVLIRNTLVESSWRRKHFRSKHKTKPYYVKCILKPLFWIYLLYFKLYISFSSRVLCSKNKTSFQGFRCEIKVFICQSLPHIIVLSLTFSCSHCFTLILNSILASISNMF